MLLSLWSPPARTAGAWAWRRALFRNTMPNEIRDCQGWRGPCRQTPHGHSILWIRWSNAQARCRRQHLWYHCRMGALPDPRDRTTFFTASHPRCSDKRPIAYDRTATALPVRRGDATRKGDHRASRYSGDPGAGGAPARRRHTRPPASSTRRVGTPRLTTYGSTAAAGATPPPTGHRHGLQSPGEDRLWPARPAGDGGPLA